MGLFSPDGLFYRLLDTKYDMDRESEAIEILNMNPSIARLAWEGGDETGQPFINGSTALHYAANDGKLQLMSALVEAGADVNASDATWYRSVLSWAANNAHLDAMRWLLDNGARVHSLDAMHAAAHGGSQRGKGREVEYVACLKLLHEAGASKDDRRHPGDKTPLGVAIEANNTAAVAFLHSIDASEV